MSMILLSSAAAVATFILYMLVMPKRLFNDREQRKRELLHQMAAEAESLNVSRSKVNLLKEQSAFNSNGILSKIPGLMNTYNLLLKSGLSKDIAKFVLGSFLIFAVACYVLRKLGPMGYLGALAVAIIIPRKYLQRRVHKRSEAFLGQFPDAVDMIVRSVKSGHPLNSAIRMIVDNMENPIHEEFKQVVDEVAYGRTLPEALIRLSHRIDEPDLHFFVVVLSVHQETGGSLAEVLTNLSSIIRKRKQLRLKIKALTSEGRATSYVLGAIPVVEFSALYFMTPGYLDPLFQLPMGRVILGAAIGLILLAMWIVRKMVDIDI